MPKFKFTIEQKQISWDCAEYEIEAEDLVEALATMKEMFEGEQELPEPTNFSTSNDMEDMFPDFCQNNKPTRILREALLGEIVISNEKFKVVFNATDGVFATPETFTPEEAKQFVEDFPKRYERQGYYRTANGNKLDPTLVKLVILNEGESIENLI